MSLLLASLLATTIVPTAVVPPSSIDPCAKFDHFTDRNLSYRRINATDLVELSDIGRSDSNESASPFSISPNGKSIAFLLRRANAQENQYCQRLMVAQMDGKGEPREIDRGGKFIRADFPLHNFTSLMSGYAKVITPRWSPDGKYIAFLKRSNGIDQVWVVAEDGETPAQNATAMPDNIDNFAWTAGGQSLVLATRPGIRLQAEAIAREARTGFLFGDRFAPDKAGRPIPTGPAEPVYHTATLATGDIRPSTPAEIELLVEDRPESVAPAARSYVKANSGAAAWLEPLHPRRLLSQSRLVMALLDGQKLHCEEPLCFGVRQIWWSVDGFTLYARQKTGWAGSQTALLRWRVGEPKPKRIMVTDDALVGCDLTHEELVCAREGSVRPRKLVAIDPDTGRERTIADPNPDFQLIKLGRAQRFHFTNAYGVESFADLVLPPDHKPGSKYPLIVVQYFSHGFLRGGTGDEFPIQLFAAKGFAVLSFARPDFAVEQITAETSTEFSRWLRKDWRDRRSVQSSLEMAVEKAVSTGAVDPNRMGISGFSDGTSTTQWALINSRLFKVAALGACCEDMYAYPLNAGPYFRNWTRELGYRFLEPGADDYWKPMSLALNADRIDTPILIQTGDSEYEIGLDVVDAFKRRGKAIELFVLENEPHFKYQPAHRLAIYERSTEWFQFWLMNQMNCDPAKSCQYGRWKVMRGAPKAEELRCDTNHDDHERAQFSVSTRSSSR
ncbi:Atxe2 family lasso peptide isopeptidase [Parasphingorhabdus sp. JC815]|uniref:Atxe2 family lasso peptide isopeptidase n=1 Tax=Parasphingorhabdus sp. JC815 TaxID=3232140 RepID=UPI00345994D1